MRCKTKSSVIALAIAAGFVPQLGWANDVVAEAGGETAAPDDDSIVVTARAEKLYRVDETEIGRLPTEPLASSQSVTILTEELIRDQGARDAQDLYRNISGVSLFSYAGVTARGFRQEEIFYDGLRGDPNIAFTVPQLANIERVEFLKGPAGMLYGQTAPGGLFNYVTKKPEFATSGSAALTAGTDNRGGVQAEATGAVNDWLAVRVGGFFEDRDLPRFGADSRILQLDAGLTLGRGPVQLTVQAFRTQQDLGGNRLRGVPTNAAGEFLASRRWNHNEPSDFLDLRSSSLQAKLVVKPTDTLTLDAAIRHTRATETQQYHEPNGLVDTNADGVPDISRRQFRDQIRDNEQLSIGANAIWAVPLGDAVSARLLIGGDHYDSSLVFDGRSLNGGNTLVARLPCPISLRAPVYRQCAASSYNLPAFTRSLTDGKRTGGYLLGELTFGPLIAIAGIRTDSFDDRSGAVRFKGSAESYRAGLTWRVTPDISLFGQYSTSFEPQSATSQDVRAGGPFEPTRGDSFEGGVKTALLGGRVQSNLAAYRIRRTNLLQADPRGDIEGDGVNNLVPFAEVTSKGFEFDLATDITDNWVLTLAYGYNDTRITATNGRTALTNSVGDRFANAPKHQLGFWTRYQLPATGFAFALGGDYVSRRLSLSNQTVKPYMVFDGSITWEDGPVKLLLRVDNIFDKVYAASGFIDRTGHFPGEPRSAFIEARYGF
jgi:iron complex outermembrane receptor protein